MRPIWIVGALLSALAASCLAPGTPSAEEFRVTLTFEGWAIESEEFAEARFTLRNRSSSAIRLAVDSFGSPFCRREAVRQDDPIVFGGTVCGSTERDVRIEPGESRSFALGVGRMSPDFYLLVDPRGPDGRLLDPVRSQAIHNPIRRRKVPAPSGTTADGI